MLESISILYIKEYFFRFVRMTPQRFEHLLSLVGPHLQRTTTKMREPISPAERQVICSNHSVFHSELVEEQFALF